MAGLVGVFALVLHRRMGRVVAAEKESPTPTLGPPA